MQSNFIEIALRHGCSPTDLAHILRIPFSKNTFEKGVHPQVFLKKVFWKYAANLQENTHEVWVALQLYWNHTSPWVFSCKFVVYLIWRRQMNAWFSRRLSFDGFLGLKIFEIFQILTKYARLEGIHPMFPYLKHLQSIDHRFVTIIKPFRDKIGETFYTGLKWMCKLYN